MSSALRFAAATVATVVAGPSDDWTQLLLWAPIGVGCLIAGVVLLILLKPEEKPSS